MATPATQLLLSRLRRSAYAAAGSDVTDAQLLGRYVHSRDEAAFEALLRRHGPMVLGVCRRYLGESPDAHDAFQATFLVLVRKAQAVSPAEMLPNWLYGVARQTAVRARAAVVKRRARERQVRDVPEPTAGPSQSHVDLRDWLDTEIARLPDNYRVVLILCDLEERTHHEAARLLGWPVGTVSSRLSRGRSLLARRLANKGGLCPGVALAPVPATLMQSTLRVGSVVVAGQTPATVLALAKGVLSAMAWKNVRTVAATLVLSGAVLLGGGLLSRATPAPLPQEEKQAKSGTPAAAGVKEKEKPKANATASAHLTRLRVVPKDNRLCVSVTLKGVDYLATADHFVYDEENGVLILEAEDKRVVVVARMRQGTLDQFEGKKVRIDAKTNRVAVEGAVFRAHGLPKRGPVPLAIDFGFPVVKTMPDARQVLSFYLGLFQ